MQDIVARMSTVLLLPLAGAMITGYTSGDRAVTLAMLLPLAGAMITLSADDAQEPPARCCPSQGR